MTISTPPTTPTTLLSTIQKILGNKRLIITAIGTVFAIIVNIVPSLAPYQERATNYITILIIVLLILETFAEAVKTVANGKAITLADVEKVLAEFGQELLPLLIEGIQTTTVTTATTKSPTEPVVTVTTTTIPPTTTTVTPITTTATPETTTGVG